MSKLTKALLNEAPVENETDLIDLDDEGDALNDILEFGNPVYIYKAGECREFLAILSRNPLSPEEIKQELRGFGAEE